MPCKGVDNRLPKLRVPAPVGALAVDMHAVQRAQQLVCPQDTDTRKLACDVIKQLVAPSNAGSRDGLARVEAECLL